MSTRSGRSFKPAFCVFHGLPLDVLSLIRPNIVRQADGTIARPFTERMRQIASSPGFTGSDISPIMVPDQDGLHCFPSDYVLHITRNPSRIMLSTLVDPDNSILFGYEAGGSRPPMVAIRAPVENIAPLAATMSTLIRDYFPDVNPASIVMLLMPEKTKMSYVDYLRQL